MCRNIKLLLRNGFCARKVLYIFYIEGQKAFEISTDYITLIRIRNVRSVILGLVTEYRETVPHLSP